VLRQRLEPSNLSGIGGDLLVVLGPQAQSECGADGRHAVHSTPERIRASAIDSSGRPPGLPAKEAEVCNLDLITVHSIVLPVLTKPWPLQALAPEHGTLANT